MIRRRFPDQIQWVITAFLCGENPNEKIQYCCTNDSQMEELRTEGQDIHARLDREEQRETKTFLKKLYNGFMPDYPLARFIRLSDILKVLIFLQ